MSGSNQDRARVYEMQTLWELTVYFHLFLSLRQQYVVLCAQIHTPTSLPREKVSAAPTWVGLRAGLKVYRREKFLPLPEIEPRVVQPIP
jgi:hypothetical protein